MDGTIVVDKLSRAFASTPRRSLLRSALAVVVVGAVARQGGGAAAAGCRRNGQECRRGTQCCSGVCRGSGANKKCRHAFSQFTCTTKLNSCPQGENSEVTGCGSEVCFCWVTAKGASLCGNLVENAANCDVCAQTFPDTICVKGGQGECPLPFACVRPCPG